ncbi:uncharacterized protein LOC115032773 [Mus caroli]|uniref:Uncharacterized protein LOC115032773 n=1 Tax=Mus caroli TaxID=10089 RepID=A0A6P7RWS8_MUSCR|nr:uncharacterized protein LOC115032773 [Mus caroli]
MLLGVALAVVRSRVPINPAHPRAAFPQQPGHAAAVAGSRAVAAGAGPRSRTEGRGGRHTRPVSRPPARRESPHAAASAPGGGGAARARRLSQHSQRRGESLPDVGGGRSGSGSGRRTMALVGGRGPVPRRPRAASLSRLTSREELPCD